MIEPDLARMARDRQVRLHAQIDDGVDALVLLHDAHVAYATGLPPAGTDASHALYERAVAVVVPGSTQPYLFSDRTATGVSAELRPALWPEVDEGAIALRAALEELIGPLAGKRVAVDEETGAMLRTGMLEGTDPRDAARVVGAARLTKTEDELACIDISQRRTEAAMADAQAALVPGTRRSEVAAAFLAALRRLGAGPNMIDPIFQAMPRRLADGPRTTTGHVAFPIGVGDPTFREGDLVWVDAGVDHHGYASDFGRTWVVGRDPTADEQRLFERWSAVVDATLGAVRPGATLGDLGRAARAIEPTTPWLPHFYLAHGIGTSSAEMPLVGTDLGAAFDDSFAVAAGMVLVIEPVIWEDGIGGHRAEDIYAVTADGWRLLGAGYPYEPFRRP